MPNRFLIAIAAADREAANQRLQAAIDETDYGDCGILDNMHCIATTSTLDEVFERIVTAVDPGDSIVVAPITPPWAALNAPTMEDCGRLAAVKKRERKEKVPA